MQKNSEHAGTLLPLHELQCECSENQEQAEKTSPNTENKVCNDELQSDLKPPSKCHILAAHLIKGDRMDMTRHYV